MEAIYSTGMAGLLDGIYDQLDRRCYERLEKLTIEDINGKIFGAG